MKRYAVPCERDEAGWWVGSVTRVAGVHAQGRSLEQLRSRLVDAMDAAGISVSADDLHLEPVLPVEARHLLTARQKADRRLEAARTQATELTNESVRLLVKRLKLSVRDAGVLLGLSHQRVQQLVD